MKTVKAYEVGGKVYRNKKEATAAEKELKKNEHIRYLTKRREQALETLKGWEKALAEATGFPMLREEPTPKFKVEDRVRVLSEGTAQGWIGIVKRYDPSVTNCPYLVRFEENSAWFVANDLEKVVSAPTPKKTNAKRRISRGK
jgi:hypothetical protein